MNNKIENKKQFMANRNYKELKVYKDIIDFSKSIKRSMKQMPVGAKSDVGMDIKKAFRKMRYAVYKAEAASDEKDLEWFCELEDLCQWVSILIDDCYEDNYLSYKGKYSITNAMILLLSIKKQVNRWKNYKKNEISKKS